MDPHALALLLITFVAAIVNGALGYGFSSITVPLALLFLTNRVLNPALIPIEVVLNAYTVWMSRSGLPNVWRRVLPVVLGIAPGILLGTFTVSGLNPGWLRLWTYLVLLPLILVQATGFRRPIKSEKSAGVVLGGGLGALYAVTTISGPPLAVLLNNQGIPRRDMRSAIGFIRLVESTLTAASYWYVGLFTIESMRLVPLILPSIALGVPIGGWLIHRLNPETFRRVCMSVDAWIVGFGLSTVLQTLHLVEGPAAYGALAVVALLDGCLLCRFFAAMRRTAQVERISA